MKYSHVFWDWNGTLINDAFAAFSAVNAMLEKRSYPLITFDQYREYIDVPIIRFYEKVMDMSCENMEALSVEFNSLCESFLSANPLFDSAPAILEGFYKRGIKQYIFSSSQNKFILPVLKRFGIDKYFEAVLGAPDCFVGSKVQRTCDYIKNKGIMPDNTVFVGDMLHDSDVAAAVGAKCILVSAGHQCASALLKSNYTVVPSLLALADYI